MRIISREREENASWRTRGGGSQEEARGERSEKGAKRAAKPAKCCRVMTPHSVYGSDVDQLYAAHKRRVCVITQCENLPTYLP